MTERAGRQLAEFSAWVDAGYPDHIGAEAHAWRRIAKAGEEHGEVIQAFYGVLGENFRKGETHDWADLVSELLDEAAAALGAVEHFTGNQGRALPLLHEKIAAVYQRAGLAEPATEPERSPCCNASITVTRNGPRARRRCTGCRKTLAIVDGTLVPIYEPSGGLRP